MTVLHYSLCIQVQFRNVPQSRDIYANMIYATSGAYPNKPFEMKEQRGTSLISTSQLCLTEAKINRIPFCKKYIGLGERSMFQSNNACRLRYHIHIFIVHFCQFTFSLFNEIIPQNISLPCIITIICTVHDC